MDHPFGPEPLWILGHNTNSIEEVNAALDQGANAVEIDVTAYAHDLKALCIDHAGIMGDDPGRASARRPSSPSCASCARWPIATPSSAR